MSEKKHHVASLYERSPAVAGLNQIQGFDPCKLLRRTVSRTGEGEVLKLDLRYKKLWFRLAYPQGRLKLNALRITEQLAIYEARVYLDRSDVEPIGNYTATCTREEATNGHYIKVAQEAALDEALTNAGFGLQFSDTCGDKNGERYGSEIPLSGERTDRNDREAVNPGADCRPQAMTTAVTTQQTVPPAEDLQPTADNADPREQTVNAVTMIQQAADVSKIPVQTEHRTDSPQPAFAEREGVQKSSVTTREEGTAMPTAAEEILSRREHVVISGERDQLPTEMMDYAAAEGRAKSTNADTPVPNGGAVSGQIIQDTAQEQARQVSYTADMPVAEIIKRMTFEEAQQVTVDEGTCNGWTLAEVAERRPPSLKWYVYGYKKNNNILRAAAQIMWDSLNAQKAG